ncbi:prenyltransferase/squalene oxidase repeat-containing protein [Pedobacter gandavensis]|uniref:Squalene cyclase C-terminal domain-containing protein n=1 Tax=Pedobacter gandavensis TaxID=2679963 RepID=A0ABR6ET13_9SPHI|nr:prenyltransferase/squalene oxidase repeat-containing protein [Pedobacter gandavensis]MBB2148401.1 hypothetical protein [Pedobacter gandavensis]
MLSESANLDQTIVKGVNYLYDHQYPNGEFCCYISDEDEMKMCIPHSNVFPTSLIAYSLLHLKELPEVSEMLDMAAAFLQYQTMRGGVWNNFTILNPLFPICPPDVDNTVCASKFLQAMGETYPSNEALIMANRHSSGLFYTWFTLRPSLVPIKDFWMLNFRAFKHPISTFLFWKKTEAGRYDIDAAVNANALFYFGYRAETAPIVDYLLDIIDRGKEADCDLWYRNPFTIYYFFSRPYTAGVYQMKPAREKIVQRILKTSKPDGSFGEGVLDTALAIISLLNWEVAVSNLDAAIAYLIRQQKRSGGWPRWAVYYGGPKKQLCYGSEEMTTGFCLEALALYRIKLQEKA